MVAEGAKCCCSSIRGWDRYSLNIRSNSNMPMGDSFSSSSSDLSFNSALREGGCRIGYEPTKVSLDHFRRSVSMGTNVEVSALSPWIILICIYNTRLLS